MNAVLALAVLELRRFVADRFNLFFVFVLPLALVGVIGLQNSSAGDQRVALTGPEASVTRLTTELDAVGVEATAYPDRDGVEVAVERDEVDLGIVVSGTQPLTLDLVTVGGEPAPGIGQLVDAAAAQVAADEGRLATLERAGLDPAAAQAAAEGEPGWTPARLELSEDAGPLGEEFAGMGRFDLGASGQLLLFVFLNTLGASAAMIQSRRNGTIRRTMAAPVTAGQTVAGLALGRFVIALFQGGYIMAMSSLLFGVRWGDLTTVLVVLAVFSLIASGLALVIGVVMDAEGPASGVSVGGGLLLAALGGCMLPLEIFPDAMRRVADLTPHAWAYTALGEAQRHGRSVLDVLPQLAVLSAMALVVLALGSWLLRRSLQRAI